MRPTVIDLFAGVGGLSLGFEQAGFKILVANEYDPSIAESYKYNHPNTKMICGDITKLNLNDIFSKYIGKIDVIIGGPPCQGFSQKGKRKNLLDNRNFLFKYFLSVVEIVKPKYFVMENVPNLLTTSNGYFLKEIASSFYSLGYFLNMKILNASNFGIPQNRKRAFIIGKMNEFPPEFPIPLSKKVSIWDAISDLSYLNSGEGTEEQPYINPPQSFYQCLLRKNNTILHNHIATKHSPIALERLKMIPPNSGKEVLPKEHITKSIYSGTWTRMGKNDISVTITTRFDTPSSGKFTHPYLNRAITVREAARLQSFPDNFVFIGNKSSQMKQVGNAVPPLLAFNIAKVIMSDIKGES